MATQLTARPALLPCLVILLAMLVAAASATDISANRYWGQCVRVNPLPIGRDGVSFRSVKRDTQATNQLFFKNFTCGGNYPCTKAKSCSKTSDCEEMLRCYGSQKQCYEVVLISCSGLPANYDGNNDGLSDDTQKHVKSLLLSTGGFVTVHSPDEAIKISDASSVNPGRIATANGDIYDLPFGVISFSASNAKKNKVNSFRIFFAPLNPALCTAPRTILKLVNGQWTVIGPNADTVGYLNDNYCQMRIKILDNGEWDSDPVSGAIMDPIALGVLYEQGSGDGF